MPGNHSFHGGELARGSLLDDDVQVVEQTVHDDLQAMLKLGPVFRCQVHLNDLLSQDHRDLVPPLIGIQQSVADMVNLGKVGFQLLVLLWPG